MFFLKPLVTVAKSVFWEQRACGDLAQEAASLFSNKFQAGVGPARLWIKNLALVYIIIIVRSCCCYCFVFCYRAVAFLFRLVSEP